MKITIYLSTYRKFCYKKRRYELPIESGAVRGGNLVKGYLRDDIGENISAENPWYGELSSLYWVWKNVKHDADDIIGFAHYNKGLNVGKKKIVNILKDHDIIVHRKSHLHEHRFPEEHSQFLNILKDYNIDFYNTYLRIFNENGAGMCYTANTFITTGKVFDEYCSLIFPIFKALRQSLGDGQNEGNHKRYCAYFGERLLIAYTMYKKLSVFEADLKYRKGAKYYFFRAWYLLNKKLLPTKYYNKFVAKFSKFFCWGSSYK